MTDLTKEQSTPQREQELKREIYKILVQLHLDGWEAGKEQRKNPDTYRLMEEPKVEAAKALLTLLSDTDREEWAITTDFFKNGGKIILRGFISKDAALIARTIYEALVPDQTFAVDRISQIGEGK